MSYTNMRIKTFVISGKWWRKNEEQPVIALHGLFDNAATFDELVPLMSENVSVLALDIPGFGRSSNPPQGLCANFLDLIVWLRFLVKHHFKWEKVSLMGHSFGSSLSFTYSAMFPEEVNKLISIDCSRLNMASKPEYLLKDLRLAYKGGVLKTLEVPYEGTYQVFLDYMFKNRSDFGYLLTEKSCRILLSRELMKIGHDLYRMPTDRRPHLKYLGRSTIPFLDGLAEQIKCHMLTIRATEGVFIKHRLEMLEKQLAVISKNCSRVVSEVIEGGHHVHLENPERVAPIINNFLEV